MMIQTEIETNLRNIMERVRWIRETKAILSKEELVLSEPMITDLSMVGNIYDLFKNFHLGKRSQMVRKQFIFVVLFLFSPSALGGSKMRRGLREKIAEVLNCTCSNISHDYKNVSFYYVTYKNFRKDVNDVISEIVEKIKGGED